MRCRFADMRRKEILGRGRDLLLSDYHNTMMANGDANEDDPASAGNFPHIITMIVVPAFLFPTCIYTPTLFISLHLSPLSPRFPCFYSTSTSTPPYTT